MRPPPISTRANPVDGPAASSEPCATCSTRSAVRGPVRPWRRGNRRQAVHDLGDRHRDIRSPRRARRRQTRFRLERRDPVCCRSFGAPARRACSAPRAAHPPCLRAPRPRAALRATNARAAASTTSSLRSSGTWSPGTGTRARTPRGRRTRGSGRRRPRAPHRAARAAPCPP